MKEKLPYQQARLAGVLCGAAASGNFTWTPEHVAQSLVCMTMSGPFLTGYTQTINDYYDREIDAINEPDRPIPSSQQRYHMTESGEPMQIAECRGNTHAHMYTDALMHPSVIDADQCKR